MLSELQMQIRGYETISQRYECAINEINYLQAK